MAKDQKHCVYMHKNKINNKIYIGQTCSLKTRWYPKCYKDSYYFYNAIQKYGWDNFEHIIVKDELTSEEADNLEQKLILQFDTTNREKGYNLLSGGKQGYNHSKETIQKIKNSNYKYWKQYFTNENTKDIGLKHMEIMHEKARKQVICLNTGEIFDSLISAAKFSGLKQATPICRCCKGERKTAGKHPITQERLRWSYYNNTEIKER